MAQPLGLEPRHRFTDYCSLSKRVPYHQAQGYTYGEELPPKLDLLKQRIHKFTPWRGRRGSNSRTGFIRSSGLANRPLHRLGYSRVWYGNWESNPDCRFRRPMPLSLRLFPRSQKKDNLFNKSLDFRLTPIILLTYSGTEEIRLSIKERPIYFLPQEVSLSILVWD